MVKKLWLNNKITWRREYRKIFSFFVLILWKMLLNKANFAKTIEKMLNIDYNYNMEIYNL